MLKKLKFVTCMVVGALVSSAAFAEEAAGGLAIVTKDATTNAVIFAPDVLALPIIDAVLKTAKWGALVALIGIGIYIIVRMFKGK
ncbi:MAG: hypothetical protein WCJ61_13340 [Paludibacter sp.]